MNVSDIFAELNDHGFGDTTTTRKLAVLQDVVYDVCSREAWPFLEKSATVTIVGGNNQVPVPADFNKALAVVIPSNGILLPERLDTVTKTYLVQPNATGQPYIYYFIGSGMYVYPTPDLNYSTLVTYIAQHPVLTADSLEADILLPSRHHRVLVLGCLAKLYAMEDDTELFGAFQQQYEQRIVTMESDLWKKQYDRPDRVIDFWDTPTIGGW